MKRGSDVLLVHATTPTLDPATLERELGPVTVGAASVADVLGRLPEVGAACPVVDPGVPEATAAAVLSAVDSVAPSVPVVYCARSGGQVPGTTRDVDVDRVVLDGSAAVDAVAGSIRSQLPEAALLPDASAGDYQHLFAKAPVPIVVYDEEGTLAFANEAAADLVGAAGPAAIRGRSVASFVPPTHRSQVRERVSRVVEDRRPVESVDLALRTVDGGRRYVEATTVPVTYRGRPAGQTVLNDVTERRRREQELERKNERLEAFANIVSHDLRNPLNVISGRAELARETGEEAHFEALEAATERMAALIDDLLRLARQGEAVSETEAVDLGDTAEDAWTAVDTGDARLVIDDDATVEADRTRLRELFENLFRNAVEHGSTSPDSQARQDAVEHGSTSPRSHAPEDAGDLTVRVGREDGRVYVADDGTGYGLTIVEEIAQAHGWSVSVTESWAGGARFELDLSGRS